ncbi:hypothetical protein PybrP1_001213 [[Pythium] brassicae (nom. inval.)]|nr:hypothetical protein PybrP1_001213 [[Pythium] brassicae (nom. inval.)]
MLHPPFMVAYAAAHIACMEAGYDAAHVFAGVNIKKELLLKIVREFRDAFEDERRLYTVQFAALEKLEDLIPDTSEGEPSAAAATVAVASTSVAAAVLHTSIAHVAKPAAQGAHAHSQYVISVSDERSPGLNWTVFRRFSEFRALRRRLEDAAKSRDMCAHCEIMAKRSSFVQFPHRRWFGNLKESTLEARRVGLNAFLDAVAKHARTCKESMTCQTRPLMDQFLMVQDMRYSFLHVNMGEQDVGLYAKVASSSGGGADDRLLTTPVGAMSRMDRLSSVSSCSSCCTQEQEAHEAQGPSEDLAAVHEDAEAAADERVSAIELEGRLLKEKLRARPSLLAYAKEKPERKPRTQSDEIVHKSRPNSLSDWESVKYQTAQASAGGRFSDPGARNDLLSFSRGSFTSNAGQRRSEQQRARARKVHLSSAAKRVKKLEEQEARFTQQQQSARPRTKFATLSPIME